ncbi:MAG: hypothetical protein DRI46_11400 [Chloroflexi bacterium]|nr:MAG: hypothetical protein DRI46_11400 [Chloroflexota bacterium]
MKPDPSTRNLVKLPENVHKAVTKMLKPMKLNQGRYDSFITELSTFVGNTERGDKKALEAISIWNNTNCRNRGFREMYLLGICRGVEDKAQAQKRNLDGLPPRG